LSTIKDLYKTWKGYLWLPVLAAGIIKLMVILSGRVPFNADEAVVALMARHIRQGSFPLFFYGQAYMGSLDTLLIGIGFEVFGEKVAVIRAVQAVLYLGTVALGVELGKRLFRSRRIGLLSGLLLAVPTVNVTLYTTVTLGGYNELLLIGNGILLLTLALGEEINNRKFHHLEKLLIYGAAWGALAGLGLWAFGFSLIYVLPSGLLLILYSLQPLRRARRTVVYILWGGVLAGFLLGATPVWIFLSRQNGSAFLQELMGSAVAVSGQIPVLLQPFVRLYSFLLLGTTVIIGLRPPWGVRWLMLPLIPFTLAYWLGVVISSLRTWWVKKVSAEKALLLAGPPLLVITGFLLTPFGNDPSGRYFIPLVVPLSILAAKKTLDWARGRPWVVVLLMSLVMIFNLGGILQSLSDFPPGLTTQFDPISQVNHQDMDRLIAFLEEEGATRGYTNYWVSYPLAFLSGEELIFIPRLPYHEDFRFTPRDDRYPPYAQAVREADQVAYITTHHQALDEYLRKKFAERGMDWKESQIGDYQVFYDLSQAIRPQDMGLGG